jgi:hypothetical protein
MPNILIDLYKDNSISVSKILEKDKCYKKWDQSMKCAETSKNPKDCIHLFKLWNDCYSPNKK